MKNAELAVASDIDLVLNGLLTSPRPNVDHAALQHHLHEALRLLHVDLQEVTADRAITVRVAVHPVGEAAGVKEQKGILNVVLHELDRLWEDRCGHLGKLVRYADDLVILCRSEGQGREGLRRVGQVCLAVRDTAGTDGNNPFDFEYVRARIEHALREFEGRFLVVRLPNITHVFYGRDVGYAVERIDLDLSLQAISASDMRRRLSRRAERV